MNFYPCFYIIYARKIILNIYTIQNTRYNTLIGNVQFQATVSQGLNRDSLKSLNISRFFQPFGWPLPTFDRGYPRYTFEFTCAEAGHRLRLGDGSLRIFLNTSARWLGTLDQKLRAFYHYIQKGVADSELTEAISSRIATLKNDSIARRHYMTWALKMADARYDGYDEGFERGREDGAYQTRLETARKFLAEGLAAEMVARCTGLPLETVERLESEPLELGSEE